MDKNTNIKKDKLFKQFTVSVQHCTSLINKKIFLFDKNNPFKFKMRAFYLLSSEKSTS